MTFLDRLSVRTVVLLMFFALIVPLAWVAPQTSSTAQAATTVKWGAVVQPRDGRTSVQETARMESLVGRKFAGLRNYYVWDTAFPTADDLWIRDTGRELWVSVKPRRTNGSTISWASIGAATPGTALYADMVRWAQRIRDFGATTHVIFNHEPETATNVNSGSAADFVAAWRTWVGVFRAVGVPNARFTWTVTAYAFRNGAQRPAQSYYPGDAYVDEIGADDYNWLDCRDGIVNAPRSFTTIFGDFRNFGAAHPNIPLVIPEWGSAESGNPNDKAAWITDARETLKRPEWSQVTYVNYYHARHTPTSRCLWYADTTPQSMAAFVAMGQDPYFAEPGGPVNGPPTARFTVSCSGLVCGFDGSTSADAEGPIAGYSWDFGDGQAATGRQASHEFAAGGTYRAALTVTDGAGATGTVSQDVTVTPSGTAEIAFHGVSRAVGNVNSAALPLPAGVQAGDALLLFASVNQTATVVSVPAGWTPVANVVFGSARALVWRATAPPGGAGAPVTVRFDRYTKVAVELLAYGGASATGPVAVATRSDTGTVHTTPTITAATGGGWLVSYWADKSSATTSWSAPAGLSVRDRAFGTPSGYISSMIGDSGGPIPAGPAGGLSAVTNAAATAGMVTLLLQP